jgi:hypothetical protein
MKACNCKCTARCVKNPLGKATSWPNNENEILLRWGSVQDLLSQPDVKHLGVLKFLLGKPPVFFFTISGPAYKVFDATSRFLLIDDIFHKVFMIARIIDNRMWF